MSNKIFYLIEDSWGDANNANAGNKARDDVNQIFSDMGLLPIMATITKQSSSGTGLIEKLNTYIASYKAFEHALVEVPKDSVVIAQFPLVAHTPLFFRTIRNTHKRDSRILHDLEMIRFGSGDLDMAGKARITLEEKSAIEECDALIVHNDAMRVYVIDNLGIAAEKVVSLGIFDYLAGGEVPIHSEAKKTDPVVVAGNLSREKSGYLYDLPADVPFRLYGAGYDAISSGNVDYRGSFPPSCNSEWWIWPRLGWPTIGYMLWSLWRVSPTKQPPQDFSVSCLWLARHHLGSGGPCTIYCEERCRYCRCESL